MYLRAGGLRGASRTLVSLRSAHPSLPNITKRSPSCRASDVLRAPARIRVYHCAPFRAPTAPRESGSSLFAAAVVLSFAVGGALLIPYVTNTPETEPDIEKVASSSFEASQYTESFLVMAPNTPPGRPGTLTSEQEDKLRELWIATLKVFGEYEPGTAEPNGTETPVASSEAPSEKEGKDGKKDKKKSRLNVFKRGKDKDDKSASAPSSGTATPSDVSTLSIADEDDKHGQTKVAKAALANTSPEDLRNAFWSMVKHDHPDGLLLRFLRARKWDVEKALVMMISTMHWRLAEMHVDDDIMKNGEEAALKDSKSSDPKIKREGEDFLMQLRMGKSYLHGVDAEGRPMCIVRARLHHGGEQSESSLERFTVYLIETARMFLRPPVDTATIVFDMTDFSMANMDYAPVKFMIKCFEANYPESLGTVLVYKAPWIFNTIWSIIRGWLDPVVAGKVHFVKGIDDLAKFVPLSQIPAELGGTEDWAYAYPEPVEGENSVMSEEEGKAKREALEAERKGLVERYQRCLLSWIAEGAEGAEGEGEGEARRAERRRERDLVADELRANYWKLDPYVRARTLYDRLGMLNEGGRIEFYPKKEETALEGAKAKAGPETGADDVD